MYRLLPLILFSILVGCLAYRLVLIEHGDMPSDIPSALINKPAPIFNAPPLLKNKPGLDTSGLEGKVTLVNFFASWCAGCLTEHHLLKDLSGKGAVLAGIDYKDAPEKGLAWLEKNGNPYDVVAVDSEGQIGVDFGVYGVPETYIIDRRGIIRYKHTGPLTQKAVETEILPLIKKLLVVQDNF
jgi:DsbE subfamily thiol:disulfide oxidoreductase